MRWSFKWDEKKSSLSVFRRLLHPGKSKKQHLKRLLKSTWDEKWEVKTLQKQIVLSESKPSKWSSSSDNKRMGGKKTGSRSATWLASVWSQASLSSISIPASLAPHLRWSGLTQPVPAHVALGAQDAIRTCGSWRSAAERPHWVRVRGWARSAGWGTTGTPRIRKVKLHYLTHWYGFIRLECYFLHGN